MKKIGIFDAKTHLSQLIAEVENDEEFIIQKRGKNVAILQPFHKEENKKKSKDAETILTAFSEIREAQSSYKSKSSSTKELVNDGRKR